MKIHALTQWGRFINQDAVTLEYAKQFPELPGSEVTIDFSGCIIDYEAASILIDEAINRLQSKSPPKRLTITFNGLLPERTLLKWLFFGSAVLKLNKHRATDAEIRERVVSIQHEFQIVFEIHVIRRKDQEVLKKFTYDIFLL